MIIDMTETKQVLSKPLSFLDRFRMIKDCFDSDEGVNAMLDACSDRLKRQVLAHYYGHIAAADRDKHKYILNLVQIFQGEKLGDIIGPVELYVCRGHDWEDATKLSYSAKSGAEQSYLAKDNS